MENGIFLKNVNQYFNDEYLFEEAIDIAVREGEITLLYGKSGSGKSSIFDMFNYMVPLHQGEVIWDGKKIESFKDANSYRSKIISTIFSNFSFISMLPILDNIKLPASLCKKKDLDNKLNEIYNEVLSFRDEDKDLDLYTLIEKNDINKLSNGQKEIINIATALLLGNKYLLVDELLRSFPDETKKKILKRLLKYFKKYNIGVFYISHWKEAIKIVKDEGIVYSCYKIENKKLLKYEEK